jgi:CDP-diacylglycerol---glycerol-3-phosphate 3-phosphatidyltransferase
MLNHLRDFFRPLINLVARPLSFIHPDILSFGTLVLSIPGYYFLTQGDSLLGSLFIVGAVFDSIDGAVAKMWGSTGKFGGVLDATIDRVYEGFLLLVIGMGGLVPWEILMLLLTFSVSVSYIKAKAEAVSGTNKVGMNQFSVGLIERGERIGTIFFACVFNGLFTQDGNEILTISLIFLTIGSLITLLWRGVVIAKVLKENK